MFRKPLVATTVVAVTVAAVGFGVRQLSAEAAAAPESIRVSADDCATGPRLSPAAMREAARNPESRIVCLSQQPPPGVPGTRTPPGPPTIPAKKRPAVGITAVPCPQGTWGIIRSNVCTVIPGYIMTWKNVCLNGICEPWLVGWLEVSSTLRSDAWPHQRGWVINLDIRALSAWGEGKDGSFIRGDVNCSGACVPKIQGFPKQLLQVGKVVSGYGSVSSTVEGVGQVAKAQGIMNIDIEGVRPAIPGRQGFLVDPEVRCDTIVSTVAGCVYPQAGIVWDLISDLYPEIAYNVKSAQNSGIVGHDVPLHRTLKGNLDFQNRQISCNPNVPRPIGKSCDEYPFASTYEGAAKFPNGGRTFQGCDRPDLPTGVTGPYGWSACMVDKDDNDDQGGDLGTFYWRNHVLDGDDFYVEVI